MSDMGTCLVITDADAVVGFRLAGVEAVAASGPAEAERLLRGCLSGACASLVLVNQEFLEACSDALRARLERLSVPIVIPLPLAPARTREETAHEYLLSLIRRAIGFQMKITRG